MQFLLISNEEAACPIRWSPFLLCHCIVNWDELYFSAFLQTDGMQKPRHYFYSRQNEQYRAHIH
nr:MAG TPA: hypothetical protein [Caudoviricetes sp.]